MGFFTLLLLGAIFVGSNGQQSQDIRQLLQEPIRQLQDPIQRFSSQYEDMFQRQNRPPGPSGTYNPPEYQQLMSQIPQKSQQPQVTSQQLPKSMAESSTSTDKLRQSLETQEQVLYAQEMLKRDEESRKRLGSRGVTTVCVQVHSDNGNPVVCGPQIQPIPVSNQITSYKSPPQNEQPQPQPQEQPKPNTLAPAPMRPQFMRVPVVYQNYQLPRQQLSLRCEPDAGINRFATNYRLATTVPMPTEYGLSLGLNDQRTVLPEGTISQYQWGAPLTRSSAGDRTLMQTTDLRKQPVEQSVPKLRTSENPLMNLYGESMIKSLDDIMRASDGAASSSSYMSTVPGFERSSDMSAIKRLEESREKLRKLTLELEEVKKARAAEEAARADDQKQQSQQQTQQISEEDRKRIASSQEPLRPAQIAEREIRQ